MEILTQPDNQLKYNSKSLFDRKSRENYFEMLKVALDNLSIVYERETERKALIRK